MKDDPHPPLRHPDPAHPSTTVIHHPEEDDTILRRWLREAVERGPKFWTILGIAAAGLIGLMVLINGLLMGESSNTEAWVDLMLARTPDQQSEVAESYPKTEAARWGLLEAAGSIYNQGFDQLATNRVAASPLLKRSHTLYKRVYDEAREVDPTLARFAALGMARTLEATGELKQAIDQYKVVASAYPKTAEAAIAERQVKVLQDAKTVEFYNWLAEYKAPEAKLPPLGQGILDAPSSADPSGGLFNPPLADPGLGGFLNGLPPASSLPAPPPGGEAPPATPNPGLDQPASPFEASPKAAAPAPSPAAADVPDDVFVAPPKP